MSIPINRAFEQAGVAPYTQTYSIRGTLVTGVGEHRFYFNRAVTIRNVRASVGTAPSGGSVIVDVNKNGTTIFTTQANRPTIATGTNTDTSNVPDVTAFAEGDYMTVDVDTITAPAADLTVQIEYE